MTDKYKYPESIRESDLNWVKKWAEDEIKFKSFHVVEILTSILQNEMELDASDINEWAESVNDQADNIIDSARMIKNITEQVKNKFEAIE